MNVKFGQKNSRMNIVFTRNETARTKCVASCTHAMEQIAIWAIGDKYSKRAVPERAGKCFCKSEGSMLCPVHAPGGYLAEVRERFVEMWR